MCPTGAPTSQGIKTLAGVVMSVSFTCPTGDPTLREGELDNHLSLMVLSWQY